MELAVEGDWVYCGFYVYSTGCDFTSEFILLQVGSVDVVLLALELNCEAWSVFVYSRLL